MANEEIHILLAEDDANLGFVIRDTLEQHGYRVDLCKDGVEALEYFRKNQYQICILDVMMPKMDGFSVVEEIRKEDKQIPVLFLTARSLKEDKIRGFMLGGDDYITKPFSIEELVLRIQVFVRRSQSESYEKGEVMQIGRYSFDPENLLLTNGELSKKLTQMEADILHYLQRHKGEVVRRSDILKSIWGEDDYFSGRSLDVFISKLRKYLKEDSDIKISNHHGVGFKLSF